jgi:hypothetical protein
MSKANNPGERRAQEPSSRNIVTDLRSRDRYMIAFNEAAGGFDVSAFNVSLEFVVRLGNRIALHHRCKPPHRCDPGNDELASELHVSERKVERGIAALKALGWIAGKRGGRDENFNFTLCIPDAADHAPPVHGLKPKNDDLIPDSMLSPMKQTPYPTEIASIPDTQDRGTEKSEARSKRALLRHRDSLI